MLPEEMERIERLISENNWIFAKSMPRNPHWYTLRRAWLKDEDFTWMVRAIRQYGYTEYFGGRPYTLLNVGGFKYWTMGDPINPDPNFNQRFNTILINRAKLPDEQIIPQAECLRHVTGEDQVSFQ